MSKLEVQYAVRVQIAGDWVVLPPVYGDISLAQRAAFTLRGEVVARAIVIAGDWDEPNRAEQAVRDFDDEQRRIATLDVCGPSTPAPSPSTSAPQHAKSATGSPPTASNPSDGGGTLIPDGPACGSTSTPSPTDSATTMLRRHL